MKDENYWIGANDRLIEGIWNYVDTNELVTFTDWTPGQPDSWHAHNEDCALFYFPHQYKWDDGPCDSKLLQICEMRLPAANPIDIIG
ncbi:asialoglycoprotein receptor 1-like [Mercenaria mercenaria]|uniref:asialoglycoprotein receptor 1-like n=1 Tax=Mercenaria mercenaria TaxID=6596 RepID=UPI00234EC16E|nr:asialoglycoprotein receptor 1-like [Mercenaria mercenaria]